MTVITAEERRLKPVLQRSVMDTSLGCRRLRLGVQRAVAFGLPLNDVAGGLPLNNFASGCGLNAG